MKFGKICGGLLLIGMLWGCAQGRPMETTVPVTETTAPVTTAPDMLSADTQLKTIWEARDTWHVLEETEGWCYAVTDLDGNGRLEILSSETHGTGNFTTLRAWEVSEDGTSLNPITENGEYGSGVVMSSGYVSDENPSAETVISYTDGSVTYYIQDDMNKDGYAHYYERKLAVFLRDGKLEELTLATMQTDYDENGGETVTCQDADGQAISQSDYDTAGEGHFAGLSRKNAAIGWLTCLHSEELREDLLRQSWECFQN